VQPIEIVKAIYDYEANADGELSIKEGDVLIVYEKEDDWILVKGEERDSKVGFVPATYVEEHNPDEASAIEPVRSHQWIRASVTDLHICLQAPAAPVSSYVDPQERVLASVTKGVASDTIETWPVTVRGHLSMPYLAMLIRTPPGN
jgi:hypothetical protein